MAAFFHTPGLVDRHRLAPEVLAAWSEHQLGRAECNVQDMKALAGQLAPDEALPYVIPTDSFAPPDLELRSVPWEGFPTSLPPSEEPFAATDVRSCEDFGRLGPGQRLVIVDEAGRKVAGDVRARQDEYLEWHARTVDGKLQSVTFVAEAYDYWQFLFQHDHRYVVEKYNDWARPPDRDVTEADLRASSDLFLAVEEGARIVRRGRLVIARGELNYRNEFNQRHGIVHLSHKANNLNAEINLAVTSALPRLDANGQLVDATNEKRLLCCTTGGEPNRSSDPNIAAGAYRAVTDAVQPKQFTLTDPIGLYILDWSHRALQDPGGNPAPRDWWDVERGEDATTDDRRDSRVLRLHLEVPPGEGFVLGEMLVNSNELRHPAQLAQLVKMHLLVDVWPAPEGTKAPRIPCEGSCCRRPDGSLSLFSPHGNDLPTSCGGDTVEFEGLVDSSASLPGILEDVVSRRRT